MAIPSSHVLPCLFVLAAIAGGCQTPTLALTHSTSAASYTAAVPTVVEPLFEETELEQFSRSSSAGNVTTTTTWHDKIWLVRPEQRRTLYEAMLPDLEKASITNTNALRSGALTGRVRVVRLTLASYKMVDQDLVAWYGCIAGAFFPLCPPLILAPLVPVFVPLKSSEKIDVIAKIYEVDTQGLRLLETPGGEYPVVDVSGGKLISQKRIELPWKSEHGLFTSFTDAQMSELLRTTFAPAITDIARAAARDSGSVAPLPAGAPLET